MTKIYLHILFLHIVAINLHIFLVACYHFPYSIVKEVYFQRSRHVLHHLLTLFLSLPSSPNHCDASFNCISLNAWSAISVFVLDSTSKFSQSVIIKNDTNDLSTFQKINKQDPPTRRPVTTTSSCIQRNGLHCNSLKMMMGKSYLFYLGFSNFKTHLTLKTRLVYTIN